MRTYVQNICQRYSVTANDYFIALVRGEFNKQDFVETQVQFESAVTHFVNPMRALSMNISGAQLRAGVVSNIADELGNGDEKQSHRMTFIDFLNRLDKNAIRTLEAREVWPEVAKFNALLDDACSGAQILRGAAVMGIIEQMFATISGVIARDVVAQEWLTEGEMVHYALHEELDHQHAEDFFLLLDAGWQNGGAEKAAIIAGFEEGAAGFFALYDGLFHARQRRWRRGEAS
jgi:hypothetical protein